MENMEVNGKKIKLIILISCIVLALIAILIIVTDNSGEDLPSNSTTGNVNNGNEINNGSGQQVVGENETELSDKEAKEFFELIPIVYLEEFAPFSDNFMLTAAMTKVSVEDVPNYMASHVDTVVEEIFGEGVSINKDNVKEIDLSKSLYYYYPETGMYCTIPVGMESVYMTQLLKYATKKDNHVYVYTNEINGTWHQEEEETVVVIGDKDGNDLVKRFNAFEETQDYTVWQEEFGERLPVFKYTLEKTEDGYILTGVEKINY